MTYARVRVDGLPALRRALRELGEGAEDLKDANAAVARQVAERAEQLAPRRTGRLAGSIRGNRAAGRATVLGGGAAVPYAGPIHWGWRARGIEPALFVTNAAEQTEPAWIGTYEDALEALVQRI